eukprot:33276_1
MQRNYLYFLTCRQRPCKMLVAAAARIPVKRVSIMMWIRRYGHTWNLKAEKL